MATEEEAAEYLAKVSSQAKSLPNVFVSPPVDRPSKRRRRQEGEIDGTIASLSYLISPKAAVAPAPSREYLPEDAWIEASLKSFENLRGYLHECWSMGVGGKRQPGRSPLPPMKDRSGWHRFCVGREDALSNPGSWCFADEDGADDHETGEVGAVPEWQKSIPRNGYEPTVRLVLQLDQVLVRRVLSHLGHFVRSGLALTRQRSAWLYSLLARLEKPVHRDDAAVLFGILKALTARRSKLDLSKEWRREELARLNCLIVVIGLYFEQGGAAVMKCDG